MRSTGLAYLLWLPCFFGLCGIQRLYAGKYVSGVLWLFTFGLLGIGQLIDLVLIPGMISDANLRWAVIHNARGGMRNTNLNNVNVNVHVNPVAVAGPEQQPVGAGAR